ncbi:Pentatricopeptide repeat-containing protein [Striga hermonthica]|uniref:Pentatricopeptide repeat-containing protein n=1 Tax=Striga hermonthica TaxID=68872 RepID=A0A9N7N7M1_STRHE|nr:Pentatricopeptide repeat-containing protein [Striga hermonthica]
MALSKLTLLNHLTKALPKPGRPRSYAPPHAFLPIRLLSFSTPEEAAAERRERKLRLRIDPPFSAFRHKHPSPATSSVQNPNTPKIPEPASALSGNRLNLHNRVLKLIRENDLDEAALLTRHSIYSNCRPTIHTCNSVMAAQLRQSKYPDLLSLHRFITQAGVASNVVTYNILFTLYLNCRKIDLALETYKQLIKEVPFNPSPTTYRILIKGLVENQLVQKAVELKNDMEKKGYKPDPTIYSYLMSGQAKNSNAELIFDLYDELKQKLGTDHILDGIIYGNLMKGHFLKGNETEAMEVYKIALVHDSPVKMNPFAYNYILEALSKNGKFNEALNLFERMKNEHNPPKTLTVNLGSYNIMVEGYCSEKKFDLAVEVFNSMGEKRCLPDTLSYNVLIDQLCNNDRLADAEELYNGMADKNISQDEYTFATLMNACFKENRPDDSARYFKTMVDSKLKPNLTVYNQLIDGLVNAGKIDEAKSFFDMMVPKIRMNDESYKFIMKALFENGKHNEVMGIVGGMLREEPCGFTEEIEEFVREGMRIEGREDEVSDIKAEVDREKAEEAARVAAEAERAKESARAAVAALLPSKFLRGDDKNSDDDWSEGRNRDFEELGERESEGGVVKEVTF